MAENHDTTNLPIVYEGVEIHRRREMLSLTDMWRAAGSDPSKRPYEWSRLPASIDFVEYIEGATGKSRNELFQAVSGGPTQGTWAHWQIGFAYAKYLSPEFHVWCNTVVRDRMEGRLPAETLAGVEMHVVRLVSLALAPAEKMIAELKARLDLLSAPSGRYKTSTEYMPALAVAEDANVPQKGRGRLVRSISNSLDRFCRREGIVVRSEAHTERRLFHVDAIARWLDLEGRTIVRRHLDRLAGQQVMRFRRKPELVQRPEAG